MGVWQLASPNALTNCVVALISVHFSAFKLLYSGRSCNRVAYTLAKQVSMDTRLGEWQYAPSCVAQLVTADCNSDAS
jgi:hypothetical protein